MNRITVGYHPTGISISPDGSTVFVGNLWSGTVSVINASTNIVTNTISVGIFPSSFGNFISSYTQPAGVSSIVNESENTSIYPNPFTSQTTLSFSEAQTNTIVKIRDVLGNIVNSQKASGKSITLDMSGVAKGIYFVEITDGSASSPTGENVIYKKIVLQ